MTLLNISSDAVVFGPYVGDDPSDLWLQFYAADRVHSHSCPYLNLNVHLIRAQSFRTGNSEGFHLVHDLQAEKNTNIHLKKNPAAIFS